MKTYSFVYFPTFTTAMLVAAIGGKTFTAPMSLMDVMGSGLGTLVIAGGKANLVMCVDSTVTVTLTDSTGGTHTSAPVTEEIKSHLTVA